MWPRTFPSARVFFGMTVHEQIYCSSPVAVAVISTLSQVCFRLLPLVVLDFWCCIHSTMTITKLDHFHIRKLLCKITLINEGFHILRNPSQPPRPELFPTSTRALERQDNDNIQCTVCFRQCVQIFCWDGNILRKSIKSTSLDLNLTKRTMVQKYGIDYILEDHQL